MQNVNIQKILSLQGSYYVLLFLFLLLFIYLFIYFFAPQFCLKVDFFNKLRTETGEWIEDDAKGESNG